MIIPVGGTVDKSYDTIISPVQERTYTLEDVSGCDAVMQGSKNSMIHMRNDIRELSILFYAP